MKWQLIGLGLSFTICTAMPALAVQPATVDASDNVAWSKVVENPFDGKIVYDRNYNRGFVFVSSWSKNGIGVTYNRVGSRLIGYDAGFGYSGFGFGHRSRGFGLGLGLFSSGDPVYRYYLTESVPDSISLAIGGKVYTYTSGPVLPELATALATAPSGNIAIRLIWNDGKTKDTEIGKDTVKAWKTIFQPS
ncbi:MAG: hypothetical protein KME45_08100 [Stenomitos rutilans HA7619-LM2]|nr:hypothetical protein [Stenomitos rutilans HA7619-LM2]